MSTVTCASAKWTVCTGPSVPKTIAAKANNIDDTPQRIGAITLRRKL
jgi:hypothetical protein